MISVPISNKVYRQKQEEMKNAKGNGDFDDLLDKIAECSREVNEKINNPGTEVITDSLRIREDNGKMGLIVGEQIVIPTEYEELIIAEDGFVLACKRDNGEFWIYMGVLYCLVFINGYIMMYRQRSGLPKVLQWGYIIVKVLYYYREGLII